MDVTQDTPDPPASARYDAASRATEPSSAPPGSAGHRPVPRHGGGRRRRRADDEVRVIEVDGPIDRPPRLPRGPARGGRARRRRRRAAARHAGGARAGRDRPGRARRPRRGPGAGVGRARAGQGERRRPAGDAVVLLAAVAPGSQTGPLLPIDVLRPAATHVDLDGRIEGWLADRGREVDRASSDGPSPPSRRSTRASRRSPRTPCRSCSARSTG